MEPSTPSPVAVSVVVIYRKLKRYLKFFKGIVFRSLWVTGKRGAMCGDHQASAGSVGTAKGIEAGKKKVEMGSGWGFVLPHVASLIPCGCHRNTNYGPPFAHSHLLRVELRDLFCLLGMNRVTGLVRGK